MSMTYLFRKTTVAKVCAAVLLLAASGCATHGSLSQKTRWYKHHSGGKSVPCPCGH